MSEQFDLTRANRNYTVVALLTSLNMIDGLENRKLAPPLESTSTAIFRHSKGATCYPPTECFE